MLAPKVVTLLTLAMLTGAACGGSTEAPPKPILADIHAGRNVGPPLVAAGAVWVANEADGTISRIDPATNRVVATISIGDPQMLLAAACGPSSVHSFMYFTLLNRRCDLPSSIAGDAKSVWVTDNANQGLARVDPRSNQVVQRISLGVDPFDIALGYGSLWVSTYFHDPHEVLRVDSGSGQVLATITDLPLSGPGGASGIAVGAGGVWVASTYGQAVARIDPATNHVTASVPVERYPLAVSAGRDTIWVRNEESSSISRVDAATNKVTATVPDAFTPDGRVGEDAMALGPDGLWVAGVEMTRIDTTRNRVVAKIDASGGGVALGFGSLWQVSVFGTVQRINPRSAVAVSAK